MKTKHLERTQANLRSAEEDIKDVYAEFEIDRQDYLDTIRKQERTIQLQEQLLAMIVPCLRRDCNYYNLDKVRSECVWDEDHAQWILPKLTVAKAGLSPINSKTSLLERRSILNSRVTKSVVPDEAQITGPSSSALSPTSSVQASVYDPPEEDKYLLHLQKSGESDYFKPKRSLELLAQSAQMKAENTLPEHGESLKKGSNICLLSPTGPTNGATVHGVDALIMGDVSYSRRPGRLQSLNVNPTLPQNLASLPEPNILEKVEKKLTNRKRRSLDPLNDKHRRPPF